MLKIYPTHRSIRKSLTNLNNDFICKSMTIDEFENKVVLIKDKTMIDKDKRILFLKKAADFENFSKLRIKKEYISFLKSSDFLFGFFEELSLEKVNIEQIDTKDTYAEYGEHLNILRQLLENYKNILEEKRYFDKITLPNIYELNKMYLKRFKKIELYLDGYLNNFEMELFLKVAKEVKLIIYFQTNTFNKKMVEKFKTLDIYLEDSCNYIIDITDKIILKKTKISSCINKTDIFFTQNKVEQVAYVKKKIYDFLNYGIDAEDIVVITPDENFVPMLKEFDKKNIFNFAMGFSYVDSMIYKRVDAIYKYMDEANIENLYRIRKYFKDIEFENLKQFFYKKGFEIDLQNFLGSFIRDGDDFEEIKIYKSELFRFKRVESELANYTLKDIIYLFLLRLKDNSIDDTKGGKVTVMGVLESRLVKYKGVIIVDFNDDTVPKKNSKDLFLSNAIRKKTNLPTLKDRENLQKGYYHNILLNAKKSAICGVENDAKKPSMFLDELNIKVVNKEKFDHKNLLNLLLPKQKSINRYKKEDLFMEYDFKKVSLSSTSFKIYLECKRKYYFKYIKKLQEAQIPTSKVDDRLIGIKLHEALKKLYTKSESYSDEKELLSHLSHFLYEDIKNDKILKFQIDIWIERLKDFAKMEIQRFNEGYKVLHKEIFLEGKFLGFNINGKIDRIDIKDKKFSLIDYKSGKVKLSTQKTFEKSKDFQMEFYYYLVKNLGEIEGLYFYDLKNADLKKEAFFEEKLELMEEKFSLLKNKKQNFVMTNDLKTCQYCPYAIICKREA